MRIPQRSSVVAVGALLLIGCGSPVGPPELTPETVAGQYVLVAFSGASVGVEPEQVAGELWLHALGGAERSVTYRTRDGAESVNTLVGSYTLVGPSLRLTLLDGSYAWRPSATLDDRVLTITYPSPSDGPAIVERYERR